MTLITAAGIWLLVNGCAGLVTTGVSLAHDKTVEGIVQLGVSSVTLGFALGLLCV